MGWNVLISLSLSQCALFTCAEVTDIKCAKLLGLSGSIFSPRKHFLNLRQKKKKHTQLPFSHLHAFSEFFSCQNFILSKFFFHNNG